jgi:acyl transferase domain-containing protein
MLQDIEIHTTMCAEMEALGGALAGGPGGSGRRLALASVKSVYGHTEGAAGATKL